MSLLRDNYGSFYELGSVNHLEQLTSDNNKSRVSDKEAQEFDQPENLHLIKTRNLREKDDCDNKNYDDNDDDDNDNSNNFNYYDDDDDDNDGKNSNSLERKKVQNRKSKQKP